MVVYFATPDRPLGGELASNNIAYMGWSDTSTCKTKGTFFSLGTDPTNCYNSCREEESTCRCRIAQKL